MYSQKIKCKRTSANLVQNIKLNTSSALFSVVRLDFLTFSVALPLKVEAYRLVFTLPVRQRQSSLQYYVLSERAKKTDAKYLFLFKVFILSLQNILNIKRKTI